MNSLKNIFLHHGKNTTSILKGKEKRVTTKSEPLLTNLV